jgi:glutathione S-transferase
MRLGSNRRQEDAIMSVTMTLYSGPLSMFGAKAQIAVAEKRLPCAVVMVPFNLRQRYEPKHADVARINPKAQVPVLIDGDLEIFDSTQIFEYLEDRAAEPALWPKPAKARAAARLLEHKSDEVFFPHVIALMGLVGTPEADAAVRARKALAAYYDEAETALGGKTYLAEAFSYADIAFFLAHYFAALLGADLDPRHSRLDAWRRRVAARPAVRGVVDAMSAFVAANRLRPPAFAAA